MICVALVGVGLDVVERHVPGVDELLDVLGPLLRRASRRTTMWSGIVPGKSAELNSTCEPWPLERLRRERGEHADAVELAAGERGRRRIGRARRGSRCRPRSCPASARPWSSRKWSTTPGLGGDRLALQVLDRGDRLVADDLRRCRSSCRSRRRSPARLPEATPDIVSFSVWVLTSSWPAAMRVERGDVVGEVARARRRGRPRRRCPPARPPRAGTSPARRCSRA